MNSNNEDIAEWRAERLRKRIADFQARRPILLRDAGQLDNNVAEWGSRLFDNTARMLVITGDTGTAKTWNVWEVLERAIKVGYAGEILFLTSAEWQDIVGPPRDQERLRKMRTVATLVVDDLGAFRINDWQLDLLGPVIDERWNNGLPTAITSNMGDFDAVLGERLTSRLGGNAIVAMLEGEDLRMSR